ncbi:MAG: hypothetical protein IJA34_07130 [Lachnospiraceae bacterium]|nr:hypothetical protein [Lachnospiraceae bacterium]
MNKMSSINIKSLKKCAFCKYWYDPTNSAIQPHLPNANVWKYDMNAKQMCLKTNREMKASSGCGRYECKVEIM